MNVVDSSAVTAALASEPGHELVDAAIAEGAVISAVNLVEVVSVMIRRSVATDLAVATVRDLPLAVMDLTGDLAIAAGVMVAATQKFGLSLGDRACLALASSPVLRGADLGPGVGGRGQRTGDRSAPVA